MCCGSGGVGKTTTSAALALRAAERGRKVVVLTIDPARRLAQSMGIEALDNTPRPVPGVDGRRAAAVLDAMMLDMKRTFDEVVRARPAPEKAEQILEQPLLHRACRARSPARRSTWRWRSSASSTRTRARPARWDLIVVDTPPSRSALDFLDAPERLSSFLDGRLIEAAARAGARAGPALTAGSAW